MTSQHEKGQNVGGKKEKKYTQLGKKKANKQKTKKHKKQEPKQNRILCCTKNKLPRRLVILKHALCWDPITTTYVFQLCKESKHTEEWTAGGLMMAEMHFLFLAVLSFGCGLFSACPHASGKMSFYVTAKNKIC